MSKWQTYRRDVYQAIDEMSKDSITVDDIVEYVRWDACRETRLHYVRDAIRDMAFDGVITLSKGEDGKALVINKTAQFGAAKIRNPWISKGAKQ